MLVNIKCRLLNIVYFEIVIIKSFLLKASSRTNNELIYIFLAEVKFFLCPTKKTF